MSYEKRSLAIYVIAFIGTLVLLLLVALLFLKVSTGSAEPLQEDERIIIISSPDSGNTYYACLSVGMHRGQGGYPLGYDNSIYSTFITVQINSGTDRSTTNQQGLACRMVQYEDTNGTGEV